MAGAETDSTRLDSIEIQNKWYTYDTLEEVGLEGL
jgi:hypothetical protein